jgi:hypothetical protein
MSTEMNPQEHEGGNTSRRFLDCVTQQQRSNMARFSRFGGMVCYDMSLLMSPVTVLNVQRSTIRRAIYPSLSLVLVLKSFSRICSAALLTLSRRSSATPRLISPTSMKSSWSVVKTRTPYRQTAHRSCESE